MTISEKLTNRHRFKFLVTDIDSWEFDGEKLRQYISEEPTEVILVVESITEETLIVRWPDGTTTPFEMSNLHWD